MVMDENEILRVFCRSWLDWIRCGAPEKDPYSRRTGLCDAAIAFGGGKTAHPYMALKYQLSTDFSYQDRTYPFGGESLYDYEGATATMHLNPERIAWVMKYA